MKVKLTAKIEIDGGSDLAHLVLRLDLVQTGVGLDDIVELEHHEELVGADALHLEVRPVILAELGLAAKPGDVGLRRAHQLALEYQPVTVVFLPQLRLLREAGRQVVGDPHRAGGTPSHLSLRTKGDPSSFALRHGSVQMVPTRGTIQPAFAERSSLASVTRGTPRVLEHKRCNNVIRVPDCAHVIISRRIFPRESPSRTSKLARARARSLKGISEISDFKDQ